MHARRDPEPPADPPANHAAPAPPSRRRVDRGVMIIAAFKLTGAVILTIAGLGALHLVENNAVTVVEFWIQRFGGDLDGRTARALLARVAGFPTDRWELVGAGALVYATILVTQGIGLMRGRSWAEWLTVFVTASFIPIECYEIATGATVWNVELFVVNSAIVIYLVRHLRRRSRAP